MSSTTACVRPMGPTMLHSSEIGPCRLQPLQFILNCMRQARGTNDVAFLRGRALQAPTSAIYLELHASGPWHQQQAHACKWRYVVMTACVRQALSLRPRRRLAKRVQRLRFNSFWLNCSGTLMAQDKDQTAKSSLDNEDGWMCTPMADAMPIKSSCL